MAYIPLNKIITDQSTKGNEFVIKSNNKDYIGPYYILYNGKFFTGKTPNDPPNIELIKPSSVMDSVWERTSEGVEFIQYADNYDGPIAGTDQYQNMDVVTSYNLSNGIDLAKTFLIPQQTFPQPTEDDYNLGVFRRYFTVKQNQSIYLEINKNTFDSLKKRKSDWNWQPYIPFSIPWTLIGEEKVTNQTNKNIVLLQEKRLKKLGLREFLRFNYLKYYRPDSGEDLYTNGGDYLNKRTGQEYVGYYHIHPIKGPMVGQFHIDSDHDFLIPITGNTSGSISSAPITLSPTPSSGYSPSSGGGGGGY